MRLPNQLMYPWFSYALVMAQFGSLFGVLITLTAWPTQMELWLIMFGGGLVGLWAVYTMRLGRFNIVPDPKADVPLVQTGPYRYIRHPMYLAILLVVTPLMWQVTEWITWGWFGLLVVSLLVKLHYEEYLLVRQFAAAYSTYQQQTAKLIPYLF